MLNLLKSEIHRLQPFALTSFLPKSRLVSVATLFSAGEMRMMTTFVRRRKCRRDVVFVTHSNMENHGWRTDRLGRWCVHRRFLWALVASIVEVTPSSNQPEIYTYSETSQRVVERWNGKVLAPSLSTGTWDRDHSTELGDCLKIWIYETDVKHRNGINS